LVGDEKKIHANIKEVGLKINESFSIIDPKTSPKKEEYMAIIKIF
jgi:phosphotransacetylase